MWYLNGTSHHGLWFPKGSECSLVGFSDSDFSGWKSDRESNSGTCHLFVNCLLSWHNKKQHIVVISIAEDEYVATSNFCAQVLWIKQQLLDYNLKLWCIPIKCDNNSAISLTKDLVLHSYTKRIDIMHHFIRDHVTKGDVIFEYVDTKKISLLIFLQNLYPLNIFTRYVGNWES